MKKRGVQVYSRAAGVLQWEDYLVNSSKQICAAVLGWMAHVRAVFLLNPRGPK